MNNTVLFSLFKADGLPIPETEHKFHPDRRWKLDYAYPDRKLAIEVEGGVFTAGRHTRGVGFLNDMEKYNAAVLLGWRILRFTPDQMLERKHILTIKEALGK